ncbi:hypothetical protein L0U85_19080 [Glycomyces sp. L485]|uniref:SCO7613 C-terminal domain-containing membrane protein n=1 Tax=Glycomyces sp. L485 TaxID=2909235 RepID=UPI001F4B16BA|nr:hypothetical protein [Glycomyces sp. L485]MCH7232939.1 hypothetical protein [Glycomyces sp. L485]
MTTFNCPRCGQPSEPERCPVCGRGPEPLLSRLAELDAALRVLTPAVRSRAAVESERREVLDGLGRLAASYRAAPTPPSGAPPTPHGPFIPAAPPPPAPAVRGEVGSKTVQTVLLGLGGLLVAAAIVIFTAVAWRHLGDAGRLAILVGFTAAMLAVPVVLGRFRLWATAETFASLAALAMWCSALAGHYQILPSGVSLSPEAVGTWTMLVLAALTAYRGAVAATAAGWALLPLAAVGSAFAAAGEVASAALLMGATAVVLAAASWVVAHRPSRYARSDLWASRLLLCGGVVLAFLAGLRVAFGLSEAWVPPVAAAVALLAAGNLLATVYARRAGATVTTMLVASAASAALVVAAWSLALRSGEAALAVPSLALLGALLAVLVDEVGSRSGEPSRQGSALAVIASLAGVAVVAADAPELTAYLASSVLIGLTSPALHEPLRHSLRRAACIGGIGVGAAGAAIALTALPVVWADLEPPGLLTWEIPIVLALLAVTAPLVPAQRRLDLAAAALAFAAVAAGGLVWHDGEDGLTVAGFALAALLALLVALASRTLSGRCAGWALLALWLPVTAGAAAVSDAIGANSTQVEFGLVAGAAAILAVAAGAPGRSRPDRVLAAILAHVLAGTTVAVMVVADWFGQIIGGEASSRVLPAAIGVYTLALVAVALMAPVKRWGYAIAALCTGTVAWWSLLTTYSVDTLEWHTVPPALVLFGFGLWRLVRRPESGSWPVLGTAIAVGIGPSLLASLGEGDAVRRVAVGAAALAVVIAGLARRWQAPLVLGAVALLVLTVNELALVWHAIPKWIPPAVGGAVLIAAGATFEKRRRDLRRLSNTVRSMR